MEEWGNGLVYRGQQVEVRRDPELQLLGPCRVAVRDLGDGDGCDMNGC